MSDTFEPGTLARVIRAYQAVYPDLLVIKTGEELNVGENDTQWPAFVWCTNRAGKGGWVPDNYIDRQAEGRGLARRDYSAAELSAAVGEEIILEQEEGGWFWATNQAGEKGWIPVEHVELDQG